MGKKERSSQTKGTRFRALYEYSPMGILLTAPDGRIFSANPAACRLFGRTEEEIIKSERSDLVDMKDPRLGKLLKEREKNGYAAGELKLIRGNGTHFSAQVSSAVYKTEKRLRTCMVIQDISDRKQAEERIRKFSRRLLSVREEEKRHLAAVLHHDVGSITVGVSARLQAAKEDLQAGKYKDALASLEESRRLFAKSVQQLKTLAKDLRPPDLDVLGLQAALRQHIHQITNKTPLKINFTDTIRDTMIPPEIQTILFRIVQECLNNVIKHADAHLVRVRLSSPPPPNISYGFPSRTTGRDSIRPTRL
jgi:PAS domain S-box-containing protein